MHIVLPSSVCPSPVEHAPTTEDPREGHHEGHHKDTCPEYRNRIEGRTDDEQEQQHVKYESDVHLDCLVDLFFCEVLLYDSYYSWGNLRM